MPSQALPSSTISNVAYQNNMLTIEFKTGSRYRYSNVPMKQYLEICSSKTPGKYYIDNIKGKFVSKKLTQHQA